MAKDPDIGDYVLATKYPDGDPCDHFCVGFVSGRTRHERYLVADNDGKQQRANGFRRAERITKEEGHQLFALFPEIGDTPGPSLWWHLARIRGEPAGMELPLDDEERLKRDNAALLAACERLLKVLGATSDRTFSNGAAFHEAMAALEEGKSAIDLAKPPNVAAEKETPPVFTFDERSYDCLADLQAKGFTEITVRNPETGEERILVLPIAAEKGE